MVLGVSLLPVIDCVREVNMFMNMENVATGKRALAWVEGFGFDPLCSARSKLMMTSRTSLMPP